MEILPNQALRHIYPEHRTNIQDMYTSGNFGAHTLAVKRLLEVDRVNLKEMFMYAESYVPAYADLPNEGIAAFFKLISTLIRASTAQSALALDAEEYCNSEANNITKNLNDIRQRLVWERSTELNDPFVD